MGQISFFYFYYRNELVVDMKKKYHTFDIMSQHLRHVIRNTKTYTFPKRNRQRDDEN